MSKPNIRRKKIIWLIVYDVTDCDWCTVTPDRVGIDPPGCEEQI